MLIFVLAITTVLTILVASTLTVTSGAIVPAQKTAYGQAADAAAQGGLQAFIAYADAHCANANSSVATCNLPVSYSGTVPITISDSTFTLSDGYSASYSWLAVKDPGNRYFRVKAVGTVTRGRLTVNREVIGDVTGGASLNIFNYGVVTGFESQSSSTVLADWPQRTIALNCAAVDAADVPLKGDNCSGATDTTHTNSISWSGASPGTAAGKVAVCNATFDAKGGRSNNLPANAPNPYVDWTESGLAGNNYTSYQPCQTSWGNQTKLLAPANPADGAGGYYSNDALLLSNSYPGGTGPLFNQPVTSYWKYTTADAGLCGTTPGQNYRSFNLVCAGYPVEVGGSPSSASTYPAVNWTQGPQIPSSAPTIPTDACIYNGPTRIQLTGDTAIVTSPQTTTSWVNTNAASHPAQCYAGASATGMAAQTVSLTSPKTISVIQALNDGKVPPTTPAIAHGSSGWPVTGQTLGTTASKSNSVFYLTNGSAGTTTSTAYNVTATPGSYTPANGDNPSTKTDGAWTPQWTSDTTTSCNVPPAFTDLRFANCYIPKGSYGDPYSWVKANVTSAIQGNPGNYTTSAQLQSLVNSFTSQGNSGDAANSAPTHADYTSHRWNVSVAQGNAGTCAQSTGIAGSTTDTAITPPSSDPFYASTSGDVHVAPSTDTSCYTATVTLQVGTCNVALVLGVCLNVGNYVWGNGTALLGGGQSVAQFKATFTVAKTTTTTTVTPATSTFPNMADVTQYQIGTNGTEGTSGPGDIYVDGTTNHTISMVAANDLIVTGTLTSSSITTQTIEAVGQNNVRIYHPVSCLDTKPADIAATSPGFCPNDITGLYSSVPPSGEAPYQQYVNMRPDLANLTIHGAVLALGNADESIQCPEPPDGGGVCGGEFTADNYGRGNSLGQLTIVGVLGMAHHAPVGQEWDIPDATGLSSRPWSGYQMAEQYQNFTAILASAAEVSGLLTTVSTTSSLWHVLSVSSVPVGATP